MVTAGSWLWRATETGPGPSVTVATRVEANLLARCCCARTPWTARSGSSVLRLVGLEDHGIVVGRRVDGGDLARAEGGVERRAHDVHGHAEAAPARRGRSSRRELARAQRQVARHVGEARRLLHALDQPLRVVVELGLVDAGQRVLVERRAAAAADAQVLQRHREGANAGDAGQVAAQAVLHVADAWPCPGARGAP